MSVDGVLPLAEIERLLAERYEIEATAFSELAGSADHDSLVYRVDTADGVQRVLKLRAKQGFRMASLLVPAYLRDNGITQAVAPVRTIDSALCVDEADIVLIVYPWLEARTVADAGLGRKAWNELGGILRSIHQTKLDGEILPRVRRESYVPSRRELLAGPGGAALLRTSDPAPAELVEFLASKSEVVRFLLDVVDRKGAELRRRNAPTVLCHADLHGWNVLTDGDARWWIIDWDEVVLAPKERDLMFLIKGIGNGLIEPEETEAVLAGYDDPDVDEELLSYYRCAWAVQDIAAYAEEAATARDTQARKNALRGLESLFDSGNIVDIAIEGIDGPPG